MKKRLLGLPIILSAICLNNALVVDAKSATNDVSEIFDYKKYLNYDYSKLSEKPYTGKTFEVGTIGHRQVVKFGKTTLKCFEVEKITDTYAVGTINSLTFNQDYTYQVTNEYILSANTSVGVKEIISAAAEFKDVANIGTSRELTTAYTIGGQVKYATNLTKNYTLSGSYDLSTIPNDKKTFSVSKVSACLEVNVVESYEEKEWWWNWWKVDGTYHTDYVVYFFIADLITFVYNDSTFGNTQIGTYDLKVLKEY